MHLSRIRALPVRHKLTLTVMLSCTIALLLTCTSLAVYEVVSSRSDATKEYDTMAAVLAENVAATLAFHDPDAAASTLSTLRTVPEIEAAAVFDSDKVLFTLFDPSETPLRDRLGSWTLDEPWWSNRVAVQQPIILSGEQLGSLHIHGVLPSFGARLFPYATAATFILLIAAGVAYALSSRLQREVSVPIQLLSDTAETVSRENDYTVRAPVVNDDEIGRLTHTFNEMLDRIQHHDRELRSAKDAAEEMARLKSAFLANMSHEIRTPLTGILGFTQVLAEEVDDHHQEWVDCVEQSAQRLLDTLNSVLDLAQIESDNMVVNVQYVDVLDEVNHVVRLFAPMAREKELTLEVKRRTGMTDVETDRSWLARILQNLVRNAIKFTEFGSVTISVDGTIDALVLDVSDTGIGISDEFIPYLFDEFKQESMGLARSHEGTGLGLAITHKLVEKMGGSIGVWSEKNVGTTITVRIPRRSFDAFASTGT